MADTSYFKMLVDESLKNNIFETTSLWKKISNFFNKLTKLYNLSKKSHTIMQNNGHITALFKLGLEANKVKKAIQAQTNITTEQQRINQWIKSSADFNAKLGKKLQKTFKTLLPNINGDVPGGLQKFTKLLFLALKNVMKNTDAPENDLIAELVKQTLIYIVNTKDMFNDRIVLKQGASTTFKNLIRSIFNAPKVVQKQMLKQPLQILHKNPAKNVGSVNHVEIKTVKVPNKPDVKKDKAQLVETAKKPEQIILNAYLGPVNQIIPKIEPAPKNPVIKHHHMASTSSIHYFREIKLSKCPANILWPIVDIGKGIYETFSSNNKLENQFKWDARKGKLDEESIKRYIEKKVNLNARGSTRSLISGLLSGHIDQTALMITAERGHTNSVKSLVELKADINAVSRTGHTALDYALRDQKQEAARFLFKKKAARKKFSDKTDKEVETMINNFKPK